MRVHLPRLTPFVLGAAMAVLATACGSASGSHSAPPATHPARAESAPERSPAQIAQGHVGEMVLAAGSLPGYTLHSRGAEKLKDQLPAKRQAHRAVITRLVTASWLASEHSFVVSPDGKLYVFSDANLFTSSGVAARIARLEQAPQPGVHMALLRRPADAPPGALLAYVRSARGSAFSLLWRQGPVIAFVRIYGHANERFTPVQEHRIGAFLAAAASAQARRIAQVESRGSRSA
jgi:hypothetical protein